MRLASSLSRSLSLLAFNFDFDFDFDFQFIDLSSIDSLPGHPLEPRKARKSKRKGT